MKWKDGERKREMANAKKLSESFDRACVGVWSGAVARARNVAKSEKGQGTTEYAILVGVLVVIAILAIMVFRPRLQELWDAIAQGINGL